MGDTRSRPEYNDVKRMSAFDGVANDYEHFRWGHGRIAPWILQW